ncbi:MAG: hypothetical protein ABEJ42_01365 [Halobacteriaceae archaeon]
MELPEHLPKRVAVGVAAAVAGFLAATAIWLGALLAAQPLQRALYHALYLHLGPWSATETAIVLVMIGAMGLAAGVPTLATVGLRGHRDRLPGLAVGLLALLAAVLAAVLVAALLGPSGFLPAIVATVALVLGVLALLAAVGGRSDGSPTFAGGLPTLAGALPALAMALFLLGFGLGWGGGYDVVAREVPNASVEAPADTDFADAPQFRETLFDPPDDYSYAYCDVEDGRRTCRLSLRGYDREAHAARVLAEHGVRCRYQGDVSGTEPGSLTALVDGTYYRVTCQTYGD